MKKELSIWEKNAAELSDGRLATLEGLQVGHVLVRVPGAAIKWASAYPRNAHVYIVPGIGDGQHVRALYDHISEHSLVVVLERDMTMMRLALETVDISDILKSQRMICVDRLDTKSLHILLGSTGDALCRQPIVTEAFVCYDDKWWADTADAVLAYADNQRTCLATDLHNSRATCDNLLDNVQDYIARPGVKLLEGLVKNYPAILVSAGPSIDKQLSLLRMYQGKAVVISCLTMLKPLLDNGIVPDYVTALDYHEISGRFFQGIVGDWPNITFCMESKVNHTVISGVKALRGNLCFIGHPWLDTMIKWPLREWINTGTTVAHFNFALAQHLGCDPIIMVGQDLAYEPGKYYPDCVLKAHEWKENPKEGPKSSERATLGFPGVSQVDTGENGPLLLTDEQMRAYHRQFEIIWSCASQKVFDCTEGGIPKENCDVVPFAEVLIEHCEDMVCVPRVAAKVKGHQSHLRLVKRSLRSWQRELRGFCKAVRANIDIHTQLVDISEDLGPIPEEWTEAQRAWLARARKNTIKLNKYSDVNTMVEDYSGAAARGRQWNDANAAISNVEGVELRRAMLKGDVEYGQLQLQAATELMAKLVEVVGKL